MILISDRPKPTFRSKPRANQNRNKATTKTETETLSLFYIFLSGGSFCPVNSVRVRVNGVQDQLPGDVVQNKWTFFDRELKQKKKICWKWRHLKQSFSSYFLLKQTIYVLKEYKLTTLTFKLSLKMTSFKLRSGLRSKLKIQITNVAKDFQEK